MSGLLRPLDEEARQALFRAYFLGALAEESRERIEEEVLGEHGLYEEMDACAEEAIRDYLSGALTPDDRARFEAHFMASPRRRERVELLRDIDGAIGRVAPPAARARPAPRRAVALALATALLLIALIVLVVVAGRS